VGQPQTSGTGQTNPGNSDSGSLQQQTTNNNNVHQNNKSRIFFFVFFLFFFVFFLLFFFFFLQFRTCLAMMMNTSTMYDPSRCPALKQMKSCVKQWGIPRTDCVQQQQWLRDDYPPLPFLQGSPLVVMGGRRRIKPLTMKAQNQAFVPELTE
jgi:hypothetical protein